MAIRTLVYAKVKASTLIDYYSYQLDVLWFNMPQLELRGFFCIKSKILLDTYWLLKKINQSENG